MLHLLTGLEPYEELLRDVLCPAYLAEKLRAHWLTSDGDSPYYIVNEVVMSLDVSAYEESQAMEDAAATGAGAGAVEQDPKDVLLHTLYRYLVLFGLGDDFASDATLHAVYASCPVWSTLLDALDLKRLHIKVAERDMDRVPKFSMRGSKKYPGGRTSASESSRVDCAEQFEKDVRQWSVHIGTHSTIIRFVFLL
jgi:hypothetical protein